MKCDLLVSRDASAHIYKSFKRCLGPHLYIRVEQVLQGPILLMISLMTMPQPESVPRCYKLTMKVDNKSHRGYYIVHSVTTHTSFTAMSLTRHQMPMKFKKRSSAQRSREKNHLPRLITLINSQTTSNGHHTNIVQDRSYRCRFPRMKKVP
jgi:hypothetical protein